MLLISKSYKTYFISLVVGLLTCGLNFTSAQNPNWKLNFQIDTRNSFIAHESVFMAGIRVGPEFKQRHRFGLGFFTTPYTITYSGKSVRRSVKTSIADLDYELSLVYGVVYYELIAISSKRWELAFPAQIGYGYTNIIQKDDDIVLGKRADFAVVAEPSIQGHYKIWPYLGLGFGMGYRLLLDGDDWMNKNYQAPIWIAKVKLFPSELREAIWKKERTN